MTLAEYQRELVRYLFGDREAPPLPNAEVYRRGVEAKAVRALGYRYPTVKALLGTDRFQTLAIAHFRSSRKTSGDWADVGERLPAWIAGQEIAGSLPYLADVATLDHGIAQVERKPYDDVDLASFSMVGSRLNNCTLLLNEGVSLFRSGFPVVSIWEAHQGERPKESPSFDRARRAIAAGFGENALIYRSGWRGVAERLSDRDLLRLSRLRSKQSISAAFGGDALQAPELTDWLQHMIARKVIVGARHIH